MFLEEDKDREFLWHYRVCEGKHIPKNLEWSSTSFKGLGRAYYSEVGELIAEDYGDTKRVGVDKYITVEVAYHRGHVLEVRTWQVTMKVSYGLRYIR